LVITNHSFPAVV